MKKNGFVMGLLCLIATATYAIDAPQMNIYEAINKAGYQRMLTQRIAKCYLSIVADVDADKYKDHLKGSAKLFKENLKELSDNAPTEEIKEQFRYVEVLWRNYQFIYNDEYSVENAQIILQFNNKILEACNKAVTQLEDYAAEQEPPTAQEVRRGDAQLSAIINVAGRQRMLTQRMLLYTIASHHGFGNAEDNQVQLQDAIKTFTETYKRLMSYSNNTADIDQQLMVVSDHWETLEQSIAAVSTNKAHRDQDVRTELRKSLKLSEQILFAFDEIVFLYERQKS